MCFVWHFTKRTIPNDHVSKGEFFIILKVAEKLQLAHSGFYASHIVSVFTLCIISRFKT